MCPSGAVLDYKGGILTVILHCDPPTSKPPYGFPSLFPMIRAVGYHTRTKFYHTCFKCFSIAMHMIFVLHRDPTPMYPNLLDRNFPIGIQLKHGKYRFRKGTNYLHFDVFVVLIEKTGNTVV